METSHKPLDVLVIDDNAHIRMLITETLRAAGVTDVREAECGQTAWRALQEHASQIILVDNSMPGESGIEWTRRLRADPESPAPHARVIMVSGWLNEQRIAEARKAGIDAFVPKPFSCSTLLERIADVAPV
ncbi:MAG: response regulator [Caulobacterales bacterium]